MRSGFLPYSRQSIDEDDIQAVVEVLRSDWLTTGPAVETFESSFAEFTGAAHAVAVSSGTAALHAAMFALGIGPGDEVIVPALTFAATANCIVFQGGTPIFADVDRGTLLLDAAEVERKVTPRTKAVIAVDYAGQPCDYDALQEVTGRYGLALVADACHSLGATYKGRMTGTLADLTTFSFHPVKHITTGEGGMLTTDDAFLARRARLFRNHGISTEHHERSERASWSYEMIELGYNYRLSDIHCALGLSQLRKLSRWLARRREIAERYDRALALLPGVRPLEVRADVVHAYHLYVARWRGTPDKNRADLLACLKARGIGTNVHYIPVHLHPFYRARFGTGPGLCPVAESDYEELFSLPMFPSMTDENVAAVINALSCCIC
ncbi:MAG: UDP-4-amino-4,6-dideoxy-N-acetyl-beta-L-altrosamine transaminase [Bryobacteraceae bacterium]|nr:UDP-4-amino-4,6-dideoxy-N-acetyl-beta-L-altrosamine transaminase [Bryobacteraceae bacterium]